MKSSVVFDVSFVRWIAAITVLILSGCQGAREASQVTPAIWSQEDAAPAHRDRFHVLHAFCPGCYNSDGGTPYARLIEFSGNLYGTTWTGGARHGWGTVFKIDTSGHVGTIYSFLGGYSYTDGGNPYSGLTVMGKLMYGTTFDGGAINNGGTVFSITPQGVETVIHSFGASGDGSEPAGDLLAYKGVLYGTTTYGGATCSGFCGAIFAVSPDGTEHIIHSFHGSDGARPYGGLIEVHGTLYGTTELSGGSYAQGTVYAVSPSGSFKRLHTFLKPGDGANPYGTLLFTNGSLYGTTYAGGAYGAGTIFKMSLNGSESVLYSFSGGLDGARPMGGLILVNGKLVGTTSWGGGGCQCGTIFALDLKGNETTLHVLDGLHDGENPQDTLLYWGNALYGTAWTGGRNKFGTVFRLELL